jgi:hypothetical protein
MACDKGSRVNIAANKEEMAVPGESKVSCLLISHRLSVSIIMRWPPASVPDHSVGDLGNVYQQPSAR